MDKYKKLKFVSIGLIFLASVLIAKDIVGAQEIEIESVITHIGLLGIGIFFFILNRGNERKVKTNRKENLAGRT